MNRTIDTTIRTKPLRYYFPPTFPLLDPFQSLYSSFLNNNTVSSFRNMNFWHSNFQNYEKDYECLFSSLRNLGTIQIELWYLADESPSLIESKDMHIQETETIHRTEYINSIDFVMENQIYEDCAMSSQDCKKKRRGLLRSFAHFWTNYPT